MTITPLSSSSGTLQPFDPQVHTAHVGMSDEGNPAHVDAHVGLVVETQEHDEAAKMVEHVKFDELTDLAEEAAQR